MKFVIISHVIHKKQNAAFFAYGPYVREMNIWSKYADTVVVVAPLCDDQVGNIDIAYDSKKLQLIAIPSFNIKSVEAIFRTLISIPSMLVKMYSAMKAADHIHLRCPGNIGLLGCIVQILFPKKTKTAKYAGNWDPKSAQPLSYRLQKWILSNTMLTKNMTVLVYGEWENASPNIKSFFTATYSENEAAPIQRRSSAVYSFLFVGSLTDGKQPMYAVKLVEQLYRKGLAVTLSLYGEGAQFHAIENYIEQNGLREIVELKGNQNKDIVKHAYQHSHFLILPSKSEGWPKVVAEAMFWGCIPIATHVSCVPYMLDHGNRGLLLDLKLEQDTNAILQLINTPETYDRLSANASEWSRMYTLEVFESEIKLLMT